MHYRYQIHGYEKYPFEPIHRLYDYDEELKRVLHFHLEREQSTYQESYHLERDVSLASQSHHLNRHMGKNPDERRLFDSYRDHNNDYHHVDRKLNIFSSKRFYFILDMSNVVKDSFKQGRIY